FLILSLVVMNHAVVVFFFSSRRRHTRSLRDWSSDVCSSDLTTGVIAGHYQIILVGSMRLTDLIMSGNDASCSPSRTSTTRAVRSISDERPTSSAKRGIRPTGRLSTQ